MGGLGVDYKCGLFLRRTLKPCKTFLRNFLRDFADARFSTSGRFFEFLEKPRFGQNQLAANRSVAPHHFEKTNCVPQGMDLAHLIGVNGSNWDGLDLVAFAAGDDEHFRFVIETVPAAKQLRNQLSIQHAKTALGVGNFLSANAADAPAHITVHDASDEWHAGKIVHAIANEKGRPRCGGCRRYKPVNFFRKMLAVGIKKDRPGDFPIEPVP